MSIAARDRIQSDVEGARGTSRRTEDDALIEKPSLGERGPIGLRIRAACLEKGWDVGELARRAHISRTTLYQLERGMTGNPRTSTLSKIASALEIDPDELDADLSIPAGCDITSRRYDDTSPNRRRRAFDRHSNPVVTEIGRQHPEYFAGWSADDWDELYSTFGTGGELTSHGVIETAKRMNRKRETLVQLSIVLETHLNEVASNLVDALYQMVRPESNLAATPELASLMSDCTASGPNNSDTDRRGDA